MVKLIVEFVHKNGNKTSDKIKKNNYLYWRNNCLEWQSCPENVITRTAFFFRRNIGFKVDW